jgi:hypothetical protein
VEGDGENAPGDAGDQQGALRGGVNTAIADAPMKAQRRLGLDLSWPRITSAFLRRVVGPMPGRRSVVTV